MAYFISIPVSRKDDSDTEITALLNADHILTIEPARSDGRPGCTLVFVNGSFLRTSLNLTQVHTVLRGTGVITGGPS